MSTWKQTQSSLALRDDEISTKVKKLISKHEKKVEDLKTVNQALASGKLSQADKEEAEDAKGILQQQVFEGNESLTAHIIRLHRDRDLNAARKERLLKSPGPGRGHKKEKSGTQSPVVPITKNTSTAVATPTATTPAAGTNQTATAAAASSNNGSTTTKPAAASPVPNPTKPAAAPAPKQTNNPPDPSVKKKRSVAGAIFAFLIAACLGAYVGKNV